MRLKNRVAIVTGRQGDRIGLYPRSFAGEANSGPEVIRRKVPVECTAMTQQTCSIVPVVPQLQFPEIWSGRALFDCGRNRLPTHVVTVYHSRVDLGSIELIVRESVDHLVEHNIHLKPRQVHSKAGVDAMAK